MLVSIHPFAVITFISYPLRCEISWKPLNAFAADIPAWSLQGINPLRFGPHLGRDFIDFSFFFFLLPFSLFVLLLFWGTSRNPVQSDTPKFPHSFLHSPGTNGFLRIPFPEGFTNQIGLPE